MSRQEETLRFLQTPLPQNVLAGITGNAPDEIKELPLKWLAIFKNKGTGFAGNIANRIRVTDVSVVPSPDDPLKMESVVTSEIEVTPDMCSERGVLDEGCIVYLIDESSITAMVVMKAYEDMNGPAGVSQTINILFHSTGLVGTTLHIISRSLASGHQSNSGKTEIWDANHHTLIASGVQLSVPPSTPAKRD